MKQLLTFCAAVAASTLLGSAAYAEIRTSADGKVVTYVAPVIASQANPIDFEHAKPKPLPKASKPIVPQWQMIRDAEKFSFAGPAAVSRASEGSGETTPTAVPEAKPLPPGASDSVSPQEYGSAGQPYTTSKAPIAKTQPYRRAGKLFFRDGSDTFVCTASMIKPGIVVTAAHCVADFGKRQYYSGWIYVPAYLRGDAPYGTWSAAKASVLAAYFNGTDSCATSGVVCEDDVAVLTLKPQSGKFAGDLTGYFSYAINGYSFTGGSALITQLGYPVALDNGALMQRTDSQGTVDASFSNNTIIGSLQTGGSSGGPWLVNFGGVPALASGTQYGEQPRHNVVVGVTSWGYTDTSKTGHKQQGASPFTARNIGTLVKQACSSTPAAC